MTEIRFCSDSVAIKLKSKTFFTAWDGCWVILPKYNGDSTFTFRGLLADTMFAMLEKPVDGSTNYSAYHEVYMWMKDNLKPGIYE